MKKIVTFMGVLTLICALTAITNTHATNTAAASNLRYVGDVNEDGIVDAKDASIILNTYSSLSIGRESGTELNPELADVNHDGFINAKDASEVLNIFTLASTGQKVEFEFVFVDNSTTTTSTTTEAQTIATTTTTSAASKITEGSVMELVSGSWYVHSEITDDLEDKLYENKAFLDTGDRFVIIGIEADYWYVSILDGDDKLPVYLRIPDECMSSYFRKIGQMTVSTATAAETTVSTTTTTAVSSVTAVSTTSTTTSATSTTTTSVEITSTATSTTTSTVKEWTAMKFTGTRAQVRSTPGIPENNPESNFIRFIHTNDIVFIKSFVGDGWYQITTSNGLVDEYVYINGWDYVPEDYPVYQFIGISWNLRSERNTECSILGTIEYGDLFEVLEIDSNGWAKCRTNKVNGEVYILVDDYNFIRLS